MKAAYHDPEDKERRVMSAIIGYWRTARRAPTYRIIMENADISSLSVVKQVVGRLIKKGLIEPMDHSAVRAIVIRGACPCCGRPYAEEG